MPGPDLPAGLDRAIAAGRQSVAELEANPGARLLAALPAEADGNGLDDDDLAESNLLDTTAAQERLGKTHPDWDCWGDGMGEIDVLCALQCSLIDLQ
jgi:hypothetical protein